MREKYYLKKATSSESDFVRRFLKDFVRRSRNVCSKCSERFADGSEVRTHSSQTLRSCPEYLRKRCEVVARTSQTLRNCFEDFASASSRLEASANASKSFRSLRKRFEGPGHLCRGCIRLYIKASERRLTRRGEGLIRRQRVRAKQKYK